MSEYQYYEFRAIDRPLTEKQMSELRRLSTRAEITETSFVNEYHWGDFRGDPVKMMWKYFDVFLYYANWGTHRLAFRVPRDTIDFKTVQTYVTDESLAIGRRGQHSMYSSNFTRKMRRGIGKRRNHRSVHCCVCATTFLVVIRDRCT